MKISNNCSYAISAMPLIAAAPDGSIVSNASICHAAILPERYVVQLQRKLARDEILVSALRPGRLQARTAGVEDHAAGDSRGDRRTNPNAEQVAIEGMTNAVGKRLGASLWQILRAAKAA